MRINLRGPRPFLPLSLLAGFVQVMNAAVTTAHLWADQPASAAYAPNATYRSASAGDARITRGSAGRYAVDLRNFIPAFSAAIVPGARGNLGNVQVTAYDAGSNFCQVESWRYPLINVSCFDVAGRPSDARFSLLAALGSSGADVAYVWASQPGSPNYTLRDNYTLGTQDQPVTITRSGAGQYRVQIGSVATTGANIQVTAYGSLPRRCQVGRWSGGEVEVSCRTATGDLADSYFTLLALKPGAGSADFSFAWSQTGTQPFVRADPQYVFAPDVGGRVSLVRDGPGLYRVRLGTRLNNIQVTAYGSDGHYCSPVDWSTEIATVSCHDASGAAADSVFDILAVNSGSRVPDPMLFGFIDLHTHPASFLGVGGREDGRQGMMWGRPAVGPSPGTASARFGNCDTETHSDLHADLTNPDNYFKRELRKIIMGIADGRGHFPDTANGQPNFEEWPNPLVVSHQQIDIPWLRRAYQGGLRVMVAAAVDNEVIDTAYGWNLTQLLPVLGDFFSARSLRTSLGMPRPGFALNSARNQLRFIRQMVGENCSFMELAFSAGDARRIVGGGRLAVVLGLEMDTLTPSEINTLVDEEGARFVTPIHFVDNAVGGSAAYEFMFTLLSGVIGAGGLPQSMVDDPASDYRLLPPFGALKRDLDFLLQSGLGWPVLGAPCPPTSTTSGRLGCSGQINSMGLTPAGRTLVRDLIARGVMVDLAHMSQRSQLDALEIAESLSRPVFDSHTGLRSDGFDEGAVERAIPASFARRLMNLGGLVGVGTGTGELDNPRRIYANAGNPLIDFRNGRNQWSLDLRSPELQQSPPLGAFSNYRITLRIGHDNVEPQNSVTAQLLSRTGVLGECVVVPEGRGAANYSVVAALCTLPPSGPSAAIAMIHGLKLSHTGRNCTSCTTDNIKIDEVILEVAAPGSITGWLTVLQRTGGNEGEVVYLKAPRPERDAAFGGHYWVTRLLPRPEDLGGRMVGLRVRTFTNEDDLGDSKPARLKVSLSGHRESTGQDLVFGTGGLPSEGTLTDDRLNFLSGGETIVSRPDRAPGLTFGDIVLTTGSDDGGLSRKILDIITSLRAAAATRVLSEGEVKAALGLAAAGIAVTVLAVIGDPVLMGIGAIAALIAVLASEQHDNWSTLVAIDAIVNDGSGERQVPFLVGYNPTQRIKGSQPDSVLFRGLPERIEANRLYAALVVNFSLTTQDRVFADGHDTERKDVGGSDNDLSFEVVFSDGTMIRRSQPSGHKVTFGEGQRIFIPFDKLRKGSELWKVVARSNSGHILVRSLDIGLMKDPAMSLAQAFAGFDALGSFENQIGLGTDLSGFEVLTPFSVIDAGIDPLVIPPDCPSGRVVAGVCTPILPGTPPPEHPPVIPPYSLNVERTAGRTDPARASRSVPASLNIGFVDVDSSRGLLDFRLRGLSTVGQLPELAVTAAKGDQLLRGSRANLGRKLFNTADGFVRAWEDLDFGASRPPTRPAAAPPVCR